MVAFKEKTFIYKSRLVIGPKVALEHVRSSNIFKKEYFRYKIFYKSFKQVILKQIYNLL